MVYAKRDSTILLRCPPTELQAQKYVGISDFVGHHTGTTEHLQAAFISCAFDFKYTEINPSLTGVQVMCTTGLTSARLKENIGKFIDAYSVMIRTRSKY
jgi:hypothetical protein